MPAFFLFKFILLVLNVVSGGQNIKTGLGCSTETMKTDTGGSAALLGTAKVLGQIKPPGAAFLYYVFICSFIFIFFSNFRTGSFMLHLAKT
ncbi:hypothetical protein ES332_D05G060400v1 [Gossypium tomentosum]|uniref:Uncharacterized protein n=1 Tax=Gossypium tomentosum TaxID=34277 RepID=A0A5D2KQX2_GOSTO|nr:hypothetical protein ES332_D05G060400v1 [Gossypium tomentosum]